MKVQRLRVRFSRGDEVKYITHLDLMRLWERALRRAKVDVAYSEGFTPHAQLSLAAPLAVGVTSAGELIDVFLADRLTPLEFMRDVSRQLPAGIELLDVQEVGLRAPSLQSELRAAEYEVSLPASLARRRRARSHRALSGGGERALGATARQGGAPLRHPGAGAGAVAGTGETARRSSACGCARTAAAADGRSR